MKQKSADLQQNLNFWCAKKKTTHKKNLTSLPRAFKEASVAPPQKKKVAAKVVVVVAAAAVVLVVVVVVVVVD